MEEDLQAVADIVAGVNLSNGDRQAVKSCLDRLPGLYQELAKTYDVRCRQEIAGVVQRLLAPLTQAAGPGPAEAITSRLRAMQERLGIPGPSFTPPAPAPAKGRTRKAG
jgi:hypothetical protein